MLNKKITFVVFSFLLQVSAVEKLDIFTEPTQFKQQLSHNGETLGLYAVNLMSSLKEISMMKVSERYILRSYGSSSFHKASELLKTHKIYEFLVFPNKEDFFYDESLGKQRNLLDLQGAVRILTDSKKQSYIYTFDGGNKFYGPWNLSRAVFTKSTNSPYWSGIWLAWCALFGAY
mgnify:CR=1 FL=1